MLEGRRGGGEGRLVMFGDGVSWVVIFVSVAPTLSLKASSNIVTRMKEEDALMHF